MTSNREDFSKQSWDLHPVLDVPDLFPPAVMFSILDGDPRSKFKDTLQRMSDRRNQQKVEPLPTVTPQQMRQGLLSVAWDAVFHEVPGDRMTLLYRNEGQQAGNKATGDGALHMVVIKSTEPPGTKWLVTRATQFEGKAVCWCIPVDVAKGKKSDVSLTLQNMIALEVN